MPSGTNTGTKTSTTTATAIKQLQTLVFRAVDEGLKTIANCDLVCTFSQQTLTKDLIAFLLLDVVKDISFVYEFEGTTICTYTYKLIFGGGIKEYGPEVPVSSMPPGTTVVVVVAENMEQPQDYRDAVFAEHGWSDHTPLQEADDMEGSTYGAFASDDSSFGISRSRRISKRIAQMQVPSAKELR